jgi:hypothetical protein
MCAPSSAILTETFIQLTGLYSIYNFFPHGSTAQFWALAASMKLSISFQLLDLGQLAGHLGRVITSSQEHI